MKGRFLPGLSHISPGGFSRAARPYGPTCFSRCTQVGIQGSRESHAQPSWSSSKWEIPGVINAQGIRMVSCHNIGPGQGLVHFTFFRHRRCCAVDISRGKNSFGSGDHEPPGGVPGYGKLCGMEPTLSVLRIPCSAGCDRGIPVFDPPYRFFGPGWSRCSAAGCRSRNRNPSCRSCRVGLAGGALLIYPYRGRGSDIPGNPACRNHRM